MCLNFEFSCKKCSKHVSSYATRSQTFLQPGQIEEKSTPMNLLQETPWEVHSTTGKQAKCMLGPSLFGFLFVRAEQSGGQGLLGMKYGHSDIFSEKFDLQAFYACIVV